VAGGCWGVSQIPREGPPTPSQMSEGTRSALDIDESEGGRNSGEWEEWHHFREGVSLQVGALERSVGTLEKCVNSQGEALQNSSRFFHEQLAGLEARIADLRTIPQALGARVEEARRALGGEVEEARRPLGGEVQASLANFAMGEKWLGRHSTRRGVRPWLQ
jgi:hypothetical protein